MKIEDVKDAIAARGISKTDKLLIILAYLKKPAPVPVIRSSGSKLGFSNVDKININAHLSASGGKATRTDEGWEVTKTGLGHLAKRNFVKSKPLTPLLDKLAVIVAGIKNSDTQRFLGEAVECANQGLPRAAVVLSWIGAMSVMYDYVIEKHLGEFNAEALSRKLLLKSAKTRDDLAMLKEADFLLVIEKISLIGKSQKKALGECLDRRNGCGHPNSYKILDSGVAHHLECLITNVFEKFS